MCMSMLKKKIGHQNVEKSNLLISSLLFHNYKMSVWYAVKDSSFDFSSLVSILGDCFVLIDKGHLFYVSGKPL